MAQIASPKIALDFADVVVLDNADARGVSSATWSPTDNSTFKIKASLFEFIKFEGLLVTYIAPPLKSGCVSIGVVPNDTTTFTDSTLVKYGHYESAYFGTQTATRITLKLSSAGNFGDELKGVTLGNKPPMVAVLVTGVEKDCAPGKFYITGAATGMGSSL